MSQALIETFERLSLDSKLHFFLTSEKGESIIVQFDRSREKPWSLCFAQQPEASKRLVSRKMLGDVLEAMGSHLQAIEFEIQNQLLMQVGFCDHFIREVTELLGPPSVQQAILGTQRLMDELTHSVEKLLAGPDASAEDEPKTEPNPDKANRRSLRIIKD